MNVATRCSVFLLSGLLSLCIFPQMALATGTDDSTSELPPPSIESALTTSLAAAAPRATTSVTYVDASGNSQTCSNAELISDNTLNGTDIYRQDITLGSDNTETWYTVSGYNEPNTVTIRGTVNLIIQDDAWLVAYSNVKMLANSGAHLII